MILNADRTDELSGNSVASIMRGSSERNLDSVVVETPDKKGQGIDNTGDHEMQRIEGINGAIECNYFGTQVRNYPGCGSQRVFSHRRLRSSSRACKLDFLFLSFTRKKRGAHAKRRRRSMWGSCSMLRNCDQSQCLVDEGPDRKESSARGNGSVLPRIRLKVKLSGDDVKKFVKPDVVCTSETGCKTEQDNQENGLLVAEALDNGTSVGDVNSAAKDSDITVASSVSVAETDTNFSKVAPFGNADGKGGVGASSPDSEVSNFVPNVILVEKCDDYNGSKVKPPKKREGRAPDVTDTCYSEIIASSVSGNGSSSSLSSKDLSQGNAPLSSTVDTSKETEVAEVLTSSISNDDAQELTKMSENISARGQKNKKCAVGSKKTRPVANYSKPRSRKKTGSKKNRDETKSTGKTKKEDKCGSVLINNDKSDSGKDFVGGADTTNVIILDTVVDQSVPSKTETEQVLSTESAWVRCDDCLKWRRIAEQLADSINQSNCRWICGDNVDKSFGDCCVAQEMSNSEINAELGISDTEVDAFDTFSNSLTSECSHTPDSREHEFVRISTNQFLHRKRKNQNIDEIMVCSCKAPADGGAGCKDGCLNRMLNIECIPGTCPCGDLCSNQQFQNRSYAKMQWARCGKKGYGLRLAKNIARGQFLIEYVGEVLDMRTYQSRLKDYAASGHKHFYFMTLDGSEVIDACGKGNLGRFINHSCDPNCRTEKWVVNGEICVGLFALRDIKKGEELTFDYNFVRVVGAAAKQCYCSSPLCRGYIGGDPANADYIDQVDSDEEFPEPVMLDEDDESLHGKRTRSGTIESEEIIVQNFEKAVEKSIVHTENVESQFDDSHNQSALELPKEETLPDESKLELNGKPNIFPEAPVVEEDVAKSLTTLLTEDLVVCSKPSDLSPDSVAKQKSKSTSPGIKRVFVKSRFYIKNSGQPCMLKRGKHEVPLSISRKYQSSKSYMKNFKPKKLIEAVPIGRFEAVEDKLNELLDVGGGISKRKDAPRGYLQLLHLTAASGSNGNGETIQRNRDLSLILDAILKTKTRAVLIDIIDKNVLQMLHNMIKQCRRDFKKIPILRKVLKVLEYLALKEVLSLEHICRGPSHPGVESFIESMLSLTEHDDKQVFQIARNFRDKWIPRHARKIFFLDRDEERRKTLNVASYAAPSNPQTPEKCLKSCGTLTTLQRNCKRKTRWDQDKPVIITGLDCSPADSSPDFKKSSIRDYESEAHVADDIPPGFSSLHKVPNLYTNVMVGKPQKKFFNRLPVAYGIPLTIVKEYRELRNSNLVPGFPFYPFPPLPPAPHPQKEIDSSAGSPSVPSDDTPSTSGSNHAGRCSRDPPSGSKRARDSVHDSGRKPYKHQKGKQPAPWSQTGARCINAEKASSSKEKLASEKMDDHR